MKYFSFFFLIQELINLAEVVLDSEILYRYYSAIKVVFQELHRTVTAFLTPTIC